MIFNTFSITVAQRSRENALLRALGASRRQVLGSVLVEALIVGVLASLAGLAAGIAVASGLQMLLAGFGFEMPPGGAVLGPRTVVARDPRRRARHHGRRVRSGPQGGQGAADRGDARRRRGQHRLRVAAADRHRPRGAGPGRGRVAHRAVRWRRQPHAVGRTRGAARVLRCVRARSHRRLPAQPRPRVPAAAPPGHRRRARPRERHAQPQAHGSHRLGADDRRRPGRVHHHPRRLHQGLRERSHRPGLHRRLRHRVQRGRPRGVRSGAGRAHGRATRGALRRPGCAPAWRRSTATQELPALDPATAFDIIDVQPVEGSPADLGATPSPCSGTWPPTTGSRSATPCR